MYGDFTGTVEKKKMAFLLFLRYLNQNQFLSQNQEGKYICWSLTLGLIFCHWNYFFSELNKQGKLFIIICVQYILLGHNNRGLILMRLNESKYWTNMHNNVLYFNKIVYTFCKFSLLRIFLLLFQVNNALFSYL